MLGEKSAHKGREARLSSLKTLYWGGGSPGIGAADKKRRKNFHALDTGEGANCYNREHSEPESVLGETQMGNVG